MVVLVVVVLMVGVVVQVVAMDSQSAGHHHTLDRAPAPVLGGDVGDVGAAVVSIRLPGGQRDERSSQREA